MTKTALITGASSGIGRGAAIRLARKGWRILAHGRREEALAETLAAIQAAGGEGKSFTAEFSDMEQVAALSAWASSGGRLDAVIHCAGSYSSDPIAPESFTRWDQIIDEIIRGTMRLTALTLPAVTAAEGSYLYICGPSSWTGMKGASGYCVARHAQAGFARALFEDVRETGVRVTLLHPGFVNTSLVNTDRVDPARMIQVEDISEMIALAVTLPNTACVTEMTVRPQRSPYRVTK
jgi:NADP-dependent 3-hydroxy acid dehydrogenase YdfG